MVADARGRGLVQVMSEAQPRSTLFTGSQRVAEKLAVDMRGKASIWYSLDVAF